MLFMIVACSVVNLSVDGVVVLLLVSLRSGHVWLWTPLKWGCLFASIYVRLSFLIGCLPCVQCRR